MIFISVAACGNGGKSSFGDTVLPTSSIFAVFASGRAVDDATNVRELADVTVTSSIQKCGCGSRATSVSKFNPDKLPSGSTNTRPPFGINFCAGPTSVAY